MDGEELTGKWHEGTFWVGLMELFYILFVVMFTGVYPFVKSHQMVHFQWVNFIVCKLYLNKAFFPFLNILFNVYF